MNRIFEAKIRELINFMKQLNFNFGVNFWVEARKSIEEKGRELIENYRKTYRWATGEELDAVEYGDMEEKIRT